LAARGGVVDMNPTRRSRIPEAGLFLVIAFLTLASRCGNQPNTNQVRVGAILSLTGSAAQYGQWSKNGIELAVSEVNSAGGIDGKQLAIIYEDDASQPSSAVAAVRKLLDADHVNAIVGPLTSSNVLAVAPVVESSRIVLLSPSGSSPKITNAGDFIFRNWPSDDFEGAAMADFLAHDVKIKDVAVLAINNEYGVGVRDVFLKRAGQNGIRILDSLTFEQDATDFRTQISRITSLHPGAIYAPGHAKEVARMILQARQLGFTGLFASSVAFESPEVFKIAGKAADGTYYTAPSFDPNSQNDLIRHFQQSYQSRFGETAEVFAAHAYDAVNILVLAFRNAKKDGITLTDALYKIRDFNGVTGNTTFDQNGDVIKPVSVKIARDGAFQVAPH
jgi:branched-chain amino acid transport system substrate-binding protein